MNKNKIYTGLTLDHVDHIMARYPTVRKYIQSCYENALDVELYDFLFALKLQEGWTWQ